MYGYALGGRTLLIITLIDFVCVCVCVNYIESSKIISLRPGKSFVSTQIHMGILKFLKIPLVRVLFSASIFLSVSGDGISAF